MEYLRYEMALTYIREYAEEWPLSKLVSFLKTMGFTDFEIRIAIQIYMRED